MKLGNHTAKLRTVRRVFGMVILFIAFTVTAAFFRNSTTTPDIDKEPPVKTVLGASTQTSSTQGGYASQLVVNQGLERWTGSTPDQWSIQGFVAKESAAGQFFTGTASAALTINASYPTSAISQTLRLRANTSYYLLTGHRESNGRQAGYSIQVVSSGAQNGKYLQSDGTWSSVATNPLLTSSASYTTYSKSFISPSEDVDVVLTLGGSYTNQNYQIWLDEICVGTLMGGTLPTTCGGSFVNGDFEAWTNATTPWGGTVSKSGASTVTQSIDAASGKHAVKMEVDSRRSGVTFDSFLSLKTTSNFRFTFYSKGTIGKQFVLVLMSKDELNRTIFLQPNGSWSTTYYDFYYTVNENYQKNDFTFTSPAYTSALTIQIKRASASAIIYVDSLFLEEIFPTPTSLPTVTFVASTTPTASPTPTLSPSPIPVVITEPIIVMSPTSTATPTPSITLSPSPTSILTMQEESATTTPTPSAIPTTDGTESPSPSISPTVTSTKPSNKPIAIGGLKASKPTDTPEPTILPENTEQLNDTDKLIASVDNQKQNSYGNELDAKSPTQKTLSYVVYVPLVLLAAFVIGYKKWRSRRRKFHPNPIHKHEYLSNESRNYLKDE